MNKIYYVYEYIDPRNNKVFYVGKGKGNRLTTHLRKSSLTKDTPKSKLIKEILNEGLSPIIQKVKENLTEEESLQYEMELIKFYGKENLTNETTGGQGTSGRTSPLKGKKLSNETKLKMSQSRMGHIGYKGFLGKHHSEESKQKMRESKLGPLNPQYGKPRGEEALKKFKEKISGENHPMYNKHHTEQTREKISTALKGTKLTEEQKQQRSETMKNLWDNNQFKRKQLKGSQNPNYKKLEEEIINKIIDYFQNKKYSIFKISKELNISRFKVQSILIEYKLMEGK